MIIYLKILLLRLYLFRNMGFFMPIEYMNKDVFNRVGCRIKYNRSTSEPVRHPVSGKVLYHKPDYNSLTFTLSRGGMTIDHWKGNSLYTYHSVQFSEKSFFGKLRFMTGFYAQFVKTISKSLEKDCVKDLIIV